MKSHSKDQDELQQIQEKLELIKRLGTNVGFYNQFFDNLKQDQYKTRVAAFDAVNMQYAECFGDFKFSDYNSFRSSLRNFRKNKK